MNASTESRSANSRGTADPRGTSTIVLRIDGGRPIAHFAAEAGLSRHCLAKWYARRCAHGEDGLLDHSSRPATSPARTTEDITDLVKGSGREAADQPDVSQRLPRHLRSAAEPRDTLPQQLTI
ncbi:helix-turn-helix domain-containing protein [Sphaerisporangium aureirubrum]|uniref:Helix-turn-helix domain-containing protein n=1 Tax=Sphaerisporangium aureirubrum TaxID=1544736 RepID=A0ABW1NM85_9ACTN